jgi:hypothetical protein
MKTVKEKEYIRWILLKPMVLGITERQRIILSYVHVILLTIMIMWTLFMATVVDPFYLILGILWAFVLILSLIAHFEKITTSES